MAHQRNVRRGTKAREERRERAIQRGGSKPGTQPNPPRKE